MNGRPGRLRFDDDECSKAFAPRRRGFSGLAGADSLAVLVLERTGAYPEDDSDDGKGVEFVDALYPRWWRY